MSSTYPQSSRWRPRAVGPVAVACAVLGGTVLAAPATAASGSRQLASGSVVRNGGFEAGTWGWNVGRTLGESLAQVPGGQNSAYSARITNTGTAAKTVVLNDVQNTVADTRAGAVYQTSAWVRASAPNQSVALRVLEFTGTSAMVRQSQTSLWLTDTAWHQMSVTHTAAGAGDNLDLNVLGWSTAPGAAVYVDNVAMTAPGTVAPSGVLPAAGRGALYGYYQSGNADPGPMESTIGRRFDAVHRYYDFNGNNAWPTAADNALSASGHTVHVAWEMQTYNGTYNAAIQPAPATSGMAPGAQLRKAWTYDQVLSGSMDRYLDATAARLAASPYKYIIDLQHEVDDQPDIGGSNALRAASGSRTQFAATHRYIVDRFRSHGVTNVTWAWTMSGWAASNRANWAGYQQLWPGRGYVDVIMWDPYNHNASDWRSFTSIVNTFYQPLKAGMLDAVDPTAKTLPTGLAEFGCMPDPRRPAWLRSVPTELRSFPDMVYTNYFSSGSWGTLQGDTESISAFGAVGSDPWYNTRG